jgi:ABC-type nickel/cobalt efflux system permease component RcnA
MENFWLNLIIGLLLIGVLIICCFNAATYNDLANNKEDLGPISSPGGARALMWFNIIFAVLIGVFGIWWIWKWLKANSDAPVAIAINKASASAYGQLQRFGETAKPSSYARVEAQEAAIARKQKEIETLSKALRQQQEDLNALTGGGMSM